MLPVRLRLFSASLVCLAALLLSACLPNGMPAFLDDGKSIVTTTSDALWVYTPADGKVAKYTPPDKISYAKMLGDQLWIGTPGHALRFDLNKKEFFPAPKELDEVEDWLRESVLAASYGHPCLSPSPAKVPPNSMCSTSNPANASGPPPSCAPSLAIRS